MDERINAHMALVKELCSLSSYHGYGSAVVWHNMAAVEAALRDAPQQAEPPEIDYEALIAACYKRTKAAQGTKGCVQFAAGAEWYREQIAARPSAPTAVEPLFAAMIAQHPGLREEIEADAVEAQAEYATAGGGFPGDHNGLKAAEKYRASKGTK